MIERYNELNNKIKGHLNAIALDDYNFIPAKLGEPDNNVIWNLERLEEVLARYVYGS